MAANAYQNLPGQSARGQLYVGYRSKKMKIG
jgi:hypothetical protein